MKIKKLYKYKSKKQIWRLIPTGQNKIVLEERNPDKKEVYFSCINEYSGKKIFKDFQLSEKYWTGIEHIENNIIYFHNYIKPDMPGHRGIIAVDINSQKITWQNDNVTFYFFNDERLYCFQQLFESRKFVALDASTGGIVEDLGNDFEKINQLKEKSSDKNLFDSFVFPSVWFNSDSELQKVSEYFKKFFNDVIIKGNVQYLLIDDLLFFSYHTINEEGSFNNLFNCVDLQNEKLIINEVINKNIANLIPESFFVKDDLLYLLIEKNGFIVYQLIK